MPLKTADDFSASVIDASKWNTVIDSGASLTVSNGRARILQSSGWSGAALQSKVVPTKEILKSMTAEFDLQISGMNYNQNGAGILPYFGFVRDGAPRGTTYYHDVTNYAIIVQFNNSSVKLGKKIGEGYLTNMYASANSPIGNGAIYRIKYTITDNLFVLYVDDTKVIEYLLPPDTLAFVGDNAVLEFYLGNYNSGQSMYLDNMSIQVGGNNKYLFQSGNEIKVFNEEELLWKTIGNYPVTKEMFDTSGMTSPCLREVVKLSGLQMNKNTASGLNFYGQTIRLSRLFDIRKIEVK